MKRLYQVLLVLIVLWVSHSLIFMREAKKVNREERQTFAEIQRQARQFYNIDSPKKKSGWKQYMRWEWFAQSRLDKDGYFSPSLHWKWWKEKEIRFNSPGAPNAAQWESRGPDVVSKRSPVTSVIGLGRLNCVAFDPYDPDTLWVGAPAGGLWKSEDGGQTWDTRTDSLPIIGVSDILVHPGNSKIMYIALGDGDGKQTVSSGIMKSLDGGETWQPTSLSPDVSDNWRIKKLLFHPSNPEVIFATTNCGIYKTTNGGKDWKEKTPGFFWDIEVSPTNPSIWLASCWEEGVFRSTDSGENWAKVTAGLPSYGFTRIALAYAPSNPQILYASYARTGTSLETGFQFYGLYRSTDGGITWTQQSDSPNIFGNTIGKTAEYNLGHWAHVLAVSPTNPDVVFCGSVNLWKSTTGGRSWEAITHQHGLYGTAMVHFDHHELVFFPGSDNTLYLCNDGGLFKSVDSGETWTDLSNGLVIRQIYRLGLSAQNPDHVIIGSHDNGSDLYSGEWISAVGGDGMVCLIDPHNPAVIYCSYQNAHMYRSDNAGQSWTNISVEFSGKGAWVTPLVIDPVNPSILYTGIKRVLKSTNRGNTWEDLSHSLSGSELTLIVVAPSNPLCIIASDGNNMFKTNDGGKTWDKIASFRTGDYITDIAFHPRNPGTIWIVFGGYGELHGWRKWRYAYNKQVVLRSDDGGVNWTDVSEDLPLIPVNCIAVDPSTAGLYIGTDLGVFYSPDGRGNWQVFDKGLPNTIVSDIEIHPTSRMVWASTFGRGVWRSNLAERVVEPEVFPPLYFSGFKVEDRSLLMRRYFHLFEWGSNPKNAGKLLSVYRLYRRADNRRTLLKEFDTSTHEYLLSTRGEMAVMYDLTTVNQEGIESLALLLTIL